MVQALAQGLGFCSVALQLLQETTDIGPDTQVTSSSGPAGATPLVLELNVARLLPREQPSRLPNSRGSSAAIVDAPMQLTFSEKGSIARMVAHRAYVGVGTQRDVVLKQLAAVQRELLACEYDTLPRTHRVCVCVG